MRDGMSVSSISRIIQCPHLQSGNHSELKIQINNVEIQILIEKLQFFFNLFLVNYISIYK